jgi:hypothetical protein
MKESFFGLGGGFVWIEKELIPGVNRLVLRSWYFSEQFET